MTSWMVSEIIGWHETFRGPLFQYNAQSLNKLVSEEEKVSVE